MKLPFSVDDFLQVFTTYNESIWPIQVFFYILAVVAIGLAFRGNAKSSQITFGILTFFWIWMGLVYHILYFSTINKVAYVFGAVFLVQGLVFLYVGVIRQSIRFEFNIGLSGILGLLFLIYSLILYPVLGYVFCHAYPQSPTFGVPCPTTIFSFGLLLYAKNKVSWFVIMIPLLWSIVGFSAALNLSMIEDVGLLIAGLVTAVVVLFFKPAASKSAVY
jgi:hypothetical protein